MAKATVAVKEKRCIHGETSCLRCALDDQEISSEIFTELDPEDIKRVVSSLPAQISKGLRAYKDSVCIAGGYIRSIISNEPVNDIDVFITEKGLTTKKFVEYGPEYSYSQNTTRNSGDREDIIAVEEGQTIEIMNHYAGSGVNGILENFDYTVAMAAIWWDGKMWQSSCHYMFYQDLASKRIRFLRPESERQGAREILRLLKYIQRGYTIDRPSLAQVISELVMYYVKADEDRLYNSALNDLASMEDPRLAKHLIPAKKKEIYHGS
jgi:hypothetical protein